MAVSPHSGMVDSGEMQHILHALMSLGYFSKDDIEHESFGGTIFIKMKEGETIPITYHQFIFCYLLPIFSDKEMEITLDMIASFYKNQFESSTKPGHALYIMIMTLIDIMKD